MDPRTDFGDVVEAVLMHLDKRQMMLWTGFPGFVTSYNAAKMTAEVQPAVMGQIRDPTTGVWSSIPMPILVDCPVFFTSGGGFTVTLPVKKGDEVWVNIANRCIDGWWQLGGAPDGITPKPQLELRMYDLSDGFCFPKVWSQPNVLNPSPSTTAAQLRSDDGKTYVEVGPQELTMTPDQGTTIIKVVPGKITMVANEIISHATQKNVWDAGGTGQVYQPGQIDTYTDGVPSNHHLPNPPEVPT